MTSRNRNREKSEFSKISEIPSRKSERFLSEHNHGYWDSHLPLGHEHGVNSSSEICMYAFGGGDYNVQGVCSSSFGREK